MAQASKMSWTNTAQIDIDTTALSCSCIWFNLDPYLASLPITISLCFSLPLLYVEFSPYLQESYYNTDSVIVYIHLGLYHMNMFRNDISNIINVD